MLFPRMLALSEVVWSPKEARDRDRFLARLPAHLARLDALGANYRVPEPVGLAAERKVLEDRTRVAITPPFPGAVVRYTTDGSEPTAASPVYTGPVSVRVSSTPVTVSARTFMANGRSSVVARERIVRTSWRKAEDVRAGALQPGLSYGYREGTFTAADDVRQPGAFDRVGTVPEVGLRGDERPEKYGLRLTGFLRVPKDALYTFYLACDDGGKLRVDDEVVVDHDGQHDATEKQGQVALRAGLHRVEVDFFQAGGGAALRLAVSAPGTARRPVPREWYAHE
jgi:hexosaminidase